MHPEKIIRNDRKISDSLDHDGVEFSVREKYFNKIKTKNNISINVFCYESEMTFPIFISNQNFKNSMDLLLVTNENKSHYVYIRAFNRFMFHKYFCKSCLQCFSCKNVLTEHKEVCLNINGAQSVRFEKGTNEFKN